MHVSFYLNKIKMWTHLPRNKEWMSSNFTKYLIYVQKIIYCYLNATLARFADVFLSKQFFAQCSATSQILEIAHENHTKSNSMYNYSTYRANSTNPL